MKSLRVQQLNKEFENNYNNWLDKQWDIFPVCFRLKDNKWNIMISAPHSVNHLREWEILKADMLTWWLALYLAEKYNLPCIYSTSYLVWDPNYDEYENSKYKQELKKYITDNDIKFLVDLHWCRSERDFAIELWTWWDNHPNLLSNNKLLNIISDSLTNSLKSYLQHNKKDISVNNIFPASNKNTVSNFVASNFNVPALQLEINFDLRDSKNEDKLSKLIQALENLIVELQEFFN